ncbi:VIT family-domain-containing protein [Lipomyces kononenkoae]|uniref:VIT family-domain-containing protein n=1 Tax=Lipomyces kononenkoae TaxID=34357 RepID=A0ACC3SUM1_LIPKO
MSMVSLKTLLSHVLSGSATNSGDAEKEARYSLRKDSCDLELEAGLDSTGVQSSSREMRSFKVVYARILSDAIIGLSDGLTVPFALTAGLSTLEDTKVVVFGGLAELIAGAISMGLGGYLAAKSEEESYRATLKQTREQTVTDLSSAAAIISDLLAPYDIPSTIVADLTAYLSASPNLDSFLMTFYHTLPKPSESRALNCALTIGLSYFVGGFVPLLPYFFVGPHDALFALRWSISIMIVFLFIFGYGKTCVVSGWRGAQNVRSGLIGGVQMVLVGGIAAGSAMALVKAFQALGS